MAAATVLWPHTSPPRMIPRSNDPPPSTAPETTLASVPQQVSSSPLASRIDLEDMHTETFATLGSAFIVGLDTALFPLNTLQTILMAERSTRSTSVTSLAMHIVRSEGVGRFWRGARTAILGSFPAQATYYTTYELAQSTLSNRDRSPVHSSPFMRGFLAGASADVVAGLIWVPTDVITQRLQTQDLGKLSFTHNGRLYRGGSDVVRRIWRHEGFMGFWRGYGGYVMSFAPASAVQWGTYELTRGLLIPITRRWAAPKPDARGNIAVSGAGNDTWWIDKLTAGASGAVAGVSAVCANNPLEVMRVRMQLLECRSRRDAESIRAGYLRLGLRILKEEGPMAFWRGLSARLATTVPAVVLAMTGYETIKEIASS